MLDSRRPLQVDNSKQTALTTLIQHTRVSGRVLLDVGYFAKSASLTVHLMECQQLAAVSKRRTTSNPYVKLYLLPDRSKAGKRKSSLKRNELSPKFDERFTFGPVQLHEFERRCLWISVWHKDRLGRNDFLGELLLPLAQVRQHLFTSDLCQSTSPKWYPLSDRLQIATANGNNQPQTSGEMAPRAPQRPAQQVASKLSEFERRAARLAQAAAVAPSIGQHSNQTPTDLGRGQQLSTGLVAAPAAPAAPHPAATDRMNVTLAPQPNRTATDSKPTAAAGQLFVALKFVPDGGDLEMARRTAQMGGELRLLIKEAHNLAPAAPDNDRLPSPLAKCYLLDSNGQRLAKQKTGALKRTANPRWDHECSFPALRLAHLQAQAIEIHLFNRDSLLSGRLAPGDTSANSLGAIRLCKSANSSSPDNKSDMKPQDDGHGLDLRPPSANDDDNSSQKAPLAELCSEREARLWTQMLARPNIWVYGELPLRHLRPLIPIPQAGQDASHTIS